MMKNPLSRLVFARLATAALLVAFTTACVQNPVTGKRNLQFQGADWERQTGEAFYDPMRQSQGGDLLTDPELTRYVQSVGDRLARQARRSDELNFEFQVLNDSVPNAWALPGGKIAINRGLLTELKSEAELAAVLGHEVVHADAAHGARAQSRGVLTQVGAIAGMILIDSQVDSSAGKQAAALIPALGAQLVTQRYGREAERESDYYGMKYMSEAGYDPQGAVELQETFVRLSEGRNQDWLSGLFASHPPSQERVENNRKTAAELPRGGEMGREIYQQKLAYQMRVKPAYDLYDQAVKAASEEDYRTARSRLDEALRIEDGEALFHVLDGDLKSEAGRPRSAISAYNRAVSLNDRFFYNYLRRGQARYEQRDWRAARSDLQASLDLLPTAAAHYLMGNLDRDAGNLDAARTHYSRAAQANDRTGELAERQLVKLDIQSNPGKYIATYGTADRNGQVYCLVGNKTRSELQDIQVLARFRDDQGRIVDGSRTLREQLPGGKQAGISFGWRTANPHNIDQRTECVVRSARVAEG